MFRFLFEDLFLDNEHFILMDSRLILLRIASLYQINWPARRVHLILSLAGARLDFAILEASSIRSDPSRKRHPAGERN